MRALIGLDIGRSGVKALAVSEEDGAITGRCEIGYPLSTPRPGWSEQDPADWWRARIAPSSSLTARALTPDVPMSRPMSARMLIDYSFQLPNPL